MHTFDEKSRLAIIVPFYNERDNIPLTAAVLMRELYYTCPNGFVVFVDDGSTDGSWDYIKDMHEINNCISGIRLKENHGRQNALMAGLMWVKDKCDVAITMDINLRYDLRVMWSMLEQYRNGADVVCAVRTSEFMPIDSLFEQLITQCYDQVMRCQGVDLIPNHADYRLMDTAALNALSHFHGEDLWLRSFVNRLGCRVETVPYKWIPGKKKTKREACRSRWRARWLGLRSARVKQQEDPRPPCPYIAEVLYSDKVHNSYKW